MCQLCKKRWGISFPAGPLDRSSHDSLIARMAGGNEALSSDTGCECDRALAVGTLRKMPQDITCNVGELDE